MDAGTILICEECFPTADSQGTSSSMMIKLKSAGDAFNIHKKYNIELISNPFFFCVFNDLLTFIFCIHGILGHNRKDFLSILLDQFIIVATNIFQEPISPLMSNYSHYILPLPRDLRL